MQEVNVADIDKVVPPRCPDCGEYATWSAKDGCWYCLEACGHEGPVEGTPPMTQLAASDAATIVLEEFMGELHPYQRHFLKHVYGPKVNATVKVACMYTEVNWYYEGKYALTPCEVLAERDEPHKEFNENRTESGTYSRAEYRRSSVGGTRR